MPKKDPSREALVVLRALEDAGPSDDGVERLGKLLAHRSNHVVGRAARLAGEWEAESLAASLIQAFAYFMENPVNSDPGCAAKQSIIEALDRIAYSDPEIYLTGVSYFQHEPVYGGSEDTAAGVRGASGHALLNCGYPDAYLVMASLLRDPEDRTRRMAMESLAGSGAYQAELMIRVAVLAGEPEPDIMSLGLQGLMAIAPERSLDFVAEFLYSADPAVAEGAALAIGEARLPESFPTLRDASERFNGPELFTLALPMALTREDAAFDLLLEAVEKEPTPHAAAALEALAIFGGDADRVTRIQRAVEARGGSQLGRAFQQHFGGHEVAD